jgi:hypothetical protein
MKINYNKLNKMKKYKIYKELLCNIEIMKKTNIIDEDNLVQKSMLKHKIVSYDNEQIFLDIL